jgi:hypothetical protein
VRIGFEHDQGREALVALHRLGVPTLATNVRDPRGSYLSVEIPDDTFTKIADTWLGEGKSLTVEHGGHPSPWFGSEESS